MAKPTRLELLRNADEPRLALGTPIDLDGQAGKVVARYVPSADRTKVCYIIEPKPVQVFA